MHIPKINERYSLPFKGFIPCDADRLLLKESIFYKFKQTVRLYRRFLTLLFYAQVKLEKDIIPTDVKKILWINISSTSIGDSIMELSGRVLLRGKYQLDLLTDVKNAQIYSNDDIFGNIFNSIEQIDEGYDLVLLDINNTKSIKFKAKYFRLTPFTPIMGYFYGADFNRMLFSYKRINALIGYQYSDEWINNNAHNYLCHSRVKTSLIDKQIVIAVGGEDQILRTYHHWDLVVIMLRQKFPECSILLIGSVNGLEMATKIMNLNLSNVTSLVNRLSLIETASVISQANYFIGADGGLMHVAEAFGLSGVVIFAKFQAEFRLAPNSLLQHIYTNGLASDIPPEQIIALLNEVMVSKCNSVKSHINK
ncbi:MAG: hypothetical protein K2Q03_10120 [Sphingobacteriaceae bacterium]|nr:hypothetical protein [Sphingobacteriaceae bacterium]